MRSTSEKIRGVLFRKPLKIGAVSLALRVIVVLLAYAGRDIVGMLWSRGVETLGIAKSLVTGAGFASPFSLPTGPTAFLTPVYPITIAGIERVFGLATPASAWAILLMQCAFSALTCVPIYLLAAQIFDLKIATRAAWIWAFFPYAVIFPTNIIWESSLSALLLTLGLLFFVHARNSASRAPWILLGACWGFACLVNAALLLLLPALLIFDTNRNRELWSRAALCMATLLICLFPWSVRNYLTFHKFFPLRDNFALELWVGNHEGATIHPSSQIHPAFNTAEVQRYQQLGEIGYMAEKRAIALHFINAHPLVFLKNTALRFLAFWLINWRSLWLLVPLLAIVGLVGLRVLLVHSHPFAWIFWIPLAIYPLPYYITHPDLKYQHPIQPLLAILCAYALTRQRASQPSRSSAADFVEVGA